MQQCVKPTRSLLKRYIDQPWQKCLGSRPTSRRYGIATTGPPSRPSDNEQTTQTRHVLRAILREITYLPDSQARQWYKKYVISRFREYGFKVWEHRHDADYEGRIQSKLREARHMHGFLKRAAEGELKPLLKVLLTTYGRQGKRRHELMRALRTSAGYVDHNASSSGSPELREHSAEDHSSSHMTANNPTEVQSPPGAKEVNQGAWTAYAPAFSPPLEALLKSQIASPPPNLTRPLLRRMRPRIDELNAWLRPMPKCRVKNQVKAWYADVLEKALPPLPRTEWQRLRDLATGTVHESIPMRRAGVEVKTISALDMVVAYGKPPAPKLFENRETHTITPRFMRRLWGKVFEQCPVMDWDGEKQQWIVTWGGQVLHRLHAEDRGRAGSSVALEGPMVESAASIIEI